MKSFPAGLYRHIAVQTGLSVWSIVKIIEGRMGPPLDYRALLNNKNEVAARCVIAEFPKPGLYFQAFYV